MAAISDSYSFEVGFQGGLIDPTTGLAHFGARDYDPVTGRWTEQDPTGWQYLDGPNLYQLELSNPVIGLDSSGEGDSVFDKIGEAIHNGVLWPKDKQPGSIIILSPGQRSHTSRDLARHG